MSMFVSVSVCEDISGTTRALYTKLFVYVAYVRGSVLVQYVDDRLHRLSAGRGRREWTALANCNLRLLCFRLRSNCSSLCQF